MSIVDLTRRLTADRAEFRRCLNSTDSKILVEGAQPAVSDPPGSMDLTV